MVSFSNTDGAHYDSVNGQSTVPSKPIQLDEKIPVQSSNFDVRQLGALLGASIFMNHNKNDNYQYKYITKSIPSPGTTTFKSRRLIFPRSKADVKKGRSSSHAGSAILYCLIVDLPESPELALTSSGHFYVYSFSIYNFTCLCQ